jgi:hypothetical protein
MFSSLASLFLTLFMHASGTAVVPNVGHHSPSPTPTPAPVSVAYEVPLTSVTVPTQCQGHTYTHAFNAPADSSVQGTSGNDLIMAGDESIVHGGSGDDCIIVNFESSAYGDDGNDILISKTGDNLLDGGIGQNTGYYHPLTDAVQNIQTLDKLQ